MNETMSGTHIEEDNLKPEFRELVAHDWDAEYLSYIKDQPFEETNQKGAIIQLASATDYSQRKAKWSQIDRNGSDNWKMANPYYVGFGNPNADILFVGKEMAFTPNTSGGARKLHGFKLLFHESIMNYYHWRKIVASAKSGIKIDDRYIKEFANNNKYDFCPMFPLADDAFVHKYYDNEFSNVFSPGHTWRLYNKTVNCLNKTSCAYDRDLKLYSDSFFSQCFMTELNYIPKENSAKLDPEALSQYRMKILKHTFFKTFPVVIFTAKTHVAEKEEETIKKIFCVERLDEEELSRAVELTGCNEGYSVFMNSRTNQHEIALDSNKKGLACPVSVYRSKGGERYVFGTWQLSGGNRWSKNAYGRLVNLISSRKRFEKR